MMNALIANMENHLMRKYAFGLILIYLIAGISIAQENQCPTIQRAAVSEARVWCTDIEEGAVCYGNSSVSADLISDDTFSTVGDTAALTDVTQITTSTENNQHGIALIDTTGYSDNSWQAIPLTVAILGDVTIANTGNENVNTATITAEIIGAQGANVRTGPTTDYRVLTALFEGDLIKLIGRFRDDSYYRVQLPSGEIAWVSASAIDADVSDLPIVEVDDPQPQRIYAPYTAFSLTTGTDDAACTEVWESGVLVQSVLNEQVRLQVNDIEILFSGTIFVQADEASTIFYNIEGEISYSDELVESGYQLTITEDNINVAAYEFSTLAPLPMEILPRYTYIGIDLSTLITPAPEIDQSPIADVLVEEPCVITTGETGANLRAGPSSDFPIQGVLAFRETVNPIARAQGSGGLIWWELAQNIWVSNQVVVTGGDCLAVPQSERIPVLLPTPTPEN